jgi:hypothetical protein
MSTIKRLFSRIDIPFDAGIWIDPNTTTKNVGRSADQVRASIFEWPVLWFSTAYLYNRSLVKGNPNRSFGIGDFLVVTAISWGLKRMAIGRRWRSI